ncbi:GGDEF domain-containing protein [Actinoplanes sp. NPDC000266]
MDNDLEHRRALERVALWSRACVMVLVGVVVAGTPDDIRWTTGWQPALWQVASVIGGQLIAAMTLAVVRLRHAADGRFRWVAGAQTVFDVLAVATPMLVIDSVAGVPVWPTAVLALMSAATRHKLTGVLIAWAVVSAALVAGVLLGHGGPGTPHGAGVALAVVVLLVTAATAGVQASSLDRYVTELHRARSAMARQARTDALTGVANRLALDEYEAARPDGEVSLVLLDLDGFKEVNDTHGHHAGDVLLKTVAERLRNRLRAEDLLVRLGGDEFVVVLPGMPPERAEEAVASWTRAVADPVEIGGGTVRVGVSAGVAHRPIGETSGLAELLRTADRRMYRDKRGRRFA